MSSFLGVGETICMYLAFGGSLLQSDRGSELSSSNSRVSLLEKRLDGTLNVAAMALFEV